MDERSHRYSSGISERTRVCGFTRGPVRSYRRGGADGRRCRSSCLKKRVHALLEPALELAAHGVGHRAEAAPQGLGLAHLVGRVPPPGLVVGPPANRVRGQRLAELGRENRGRRHLRVGLLVAGEALHDLAELLHPFPGRLRIHLGALEGGRPRVDDGVHRLREAVDERLGLRPGHGRRLLPLPLDAPGRASPARRRAPARRRRASRARPPGPRRSVRARPTAAPVRDRSDGRSGRRTSRTPCGTAPAALPIGCASPGRPAAIPPGCASPRPGHDPSRCSRGAPPPARRWPPSS